MTTLLHIDASVRSDRSLSRKLSQAFVDAWVAQDEEAQVIVRDIGRTPPPFITEAWIAAVFTPEAQMTAEKREALRLSDELIEELNRAEVIVIGTPMYNYGMPAQLKSWFDNVIRIGKTFSFDLARGDYPLEPVMQGKKLVILSSRGEFGFGPGGIREAMNHLDTHIQTCAHYLGVNETHGISIDYQEFGDARHEASIEQAFATAPRLAKQMISEMNTQLAPA